jgi:putative FmdB family regulatory protein
MPIFEYICKECHYQFETLVYGKQKAACPKCHATKLEPQLSVFAVSAKGSSASRILRRSSGPRRVLGWRYELVGYESCLKSLPDQGLIRARCCVDPAFHDCLQTMGIAWCAAICVLRSNLTRRHQEKKFSS